MSPVTPRNKVDTTCNTMDADSRLCRLCHQTIPPKLVRNLFSLSLANVKRYLTEFFGQYHKDDGQSGKICQQCFNKLNRISRLDMEIATRVKDLKAKRKQIWNDLVLASKPQEVSSASQCSVTCTQASVQRQTIAAKSPRKIQPLVPLKPKPALLVSVPAKSPRKIQPLVPLKAKPVLLASVPATPLQVQQEWMLLSEKLQLGKEFNVQESPGTVAQTSLEKNFCLEGSKQPLIVVTPSGTWDSTEAASLHITQVMENATPFYDKLAKTQEVSDNVLVLNHGEGLCAIKREDPDDSDCTDVDSEEHNMAIKIGNLREIIERVDCPGVREEEMPCVIHKIKVEENCDDIMDDIMQTINTAVSGGIEERVYSINVKYDKDDDTGEEEGVYSDSDPATSQPGVCVVKKEENSDTECSDVSSEDGIREENVSDTVHNIKEEENCEEGDGQEDRNDGSSDDRSMREDEDEMSCTDDVTSDIADSCSDRVYHGVGDEDSSDWFHDIGKEDQNKIVGEQLGPQQGSSTSRMELGVLQAHTGRTHEGPVPSETGFTDSEDGELTVEGQRDSHVNGKRNVTERGGVKSYGCRICGCFIQTGKLAAHEKAHVQKKRHVCGTCGKGFARLLLLKNHAKIHTEGKPYTCSVCEKTFKTAAYLRCHSRIHTGEKPHVCSTCGKTFKESTHMRTHERIHTGERPYVCVTCGRSFSQSQDLRRHVPIHTGERPYTCNVCGRNFLREHSLKRHSKQHTGKHVCNLCGKIFNHVSTFEKHVRSKVHERPYTCSACGESFFRARHLKDHAKTHTL